MKKRSIFKTLSVLSIMLVLLLPVSSSADTSSYEAQSFGSWLTASALSSIADFGHAAVTYVESFFSNFGKKSTTTVIVEPAAPVAPTPVNIVQPAPAPVSTPAPAPVQTVVREIVHDAGTQSIVYTSNGVTEAELNTRLADLQSDFESQIANVKDIIGGSVSNVAVSIGNSIAQSSQGSSGSTGVFSGNLTINGTGTTTSAGGIDLSGGCFAINHVCIGGSSGGSSFGQSWELVNGALSPTTTAPILVNNATSTITNLVTVKASSTEATSTSFFATTFKATNATTTSLAVTGSATSTFTGAVRSTCFSVDGNTCLTSSGGGSSNSKWATSTLTDITPNGGGGIMVFASSTITSLSVVNGTTTNATSTNFTATNATITNLAITRATSTAATSTSLFATTFNATNSTTTSLAVTGSGTSTFSGAVRSTCFTVDGTTCLTSSAGGSSNSKWATSTLTDITPNGGGGIMVFASSSITSLTVVNSTTTNATTTNLYASGFIGIGSTSPSAKLSIKGVGTTAGRAFAISNSSGSDRFVVTDAGNVSISGGALNVNSNNVLAGVFVADSTGIFEFSGRGQYSAPSDGEFLLQNWAANGFSRMDFGGTTTSFPALARNGTTLGVMLADGSAGGKFGVGTTTPWATLAVNPVAGGASNQFVIGSSTATSFVVNNSGQVGIGTTTPGTILSIGNTGATTINISATATSTFGKGIDVRSGCFSVNGTCIGGGGSSQWTTSGSDIYYASGKVAVNTSNVSNGEFTSYSPSDTFPAYYAVVNNASGASFFQGSFSLGGAQAFNIYNDSGIRMSVNGSANLHMDGGGNADIPGTMSATTFSGDFQGTVHGIEYYISDVLGNSAGNCTNAQFDSGLMTNCFNDVSDRRLKTNITSITGVLDKLNQLNAITYDWNDVYQQMRLDGVGSSTRAAIIKELQTGVRSSDELANSIVDIFKKRNVGLIAQDVQAVFPDLATQDKNGYLGIDYTHMSAVLVEAIKELNVKVDTLASSTALFGTTTNSSVTSLITSALETLGVHFSNGIAYIRSLFVDSLTVGSPDKPTGITVYDKNGKAGCLTVDDVVIGTTHVTAGACGTVNDNSNFSGGGSSDNGGNQTGTTTPTGTDSGTSSSTPPTTSGTTTPPAEVTPSNSPETPPTTPETTPPASPDSTPAPTGDTGN